MSEKHCIVDDCPNPVHCRNRCRRHYDKWRNSDANWVQIRRKHGGVDNGKKTREYKTWGSAKDRCFNPNHRHFHHYGGRGITMCDRYRNSFSEFLSDLGKRPAGFSLDRINNDAGYTCGKCKHCKQNDWSFNLRWVNQSDQMRNTRRNVVLEFNGRSQCMADWAIELGINRDTLDNRIKRGWTIHRAFTTPVQVKTTNARLHQLPLFAEAE